VRPVASGSISPRALAAAQPFAFTDWIKNGRVLVNGKAEKRSYVLKGSERIDVEPAELTPLRAVPEDLPLEILYEDTDVIAINKPAGMVVHAGAGRHSGTLVNALVHRFGKLSHVGGDLRPGIVHRLDRFTSGVILVAPNGCRTSPPGRTVLQPQSRKDLPDPRAWPSVTKERGRITYADHSRSSPTHSDDYEAGAWPIRDHRIQSTAPPRRLHFSGSKNRHWPHTPNPRSPCQHRPPSRGRQTLRRTSKPSPTRLSARSPNHLHQPSLQHRITVTAPLPENLQQHLVTLK